MVTGLEVLWFKGTKKMTCYHQAFLTTASMEGAEPNNSPVRHIFTRPLRWKLIGKMVELSLCLRSSHRDRLQCEKLKVLILRSVALSDVQHVLAEMKTKLEFSVFSF